MKTIAIIGGGFSGTLTTINLLRFCEQPLRVCLINAGFPLARGVAYSTTRPEHLLNVAARNMSAFPDHPTHFVEWLQTRHDYATVPEATLRELFIPRRVYGDYLRGLLFRYSHTIEGHPVWQLEVVEDEAVDIMPAGEQATVVLASGGTIQADKVVLATGNQPPCELPAPGAGLRHPNYCPSPWDDWESRLPDRHESVVLLGTGLTMVDALLTLLAHDWQGPIYAVSRNALLPLSHFRGIEYPDFPPPDVAQMGLTALMQLMDEHAERLKSQGANPAIVVDRMRPHTQRVWQHFSLEEKRQFCRQYATRWNVTRHRIAQQIHHTLTAALESGRLRVVQGAISNLEAAGECIRVTLQDADGQQNALYGALVINCTGPQPGFSQSSSPLFQHLLSRGLVQPDELDMGLRVDADFNLVEPSGERSRWLLAMGPLLKGTLWETTAVPELRGQALRVAELLLEELGAAEEVPFDWAAHAEEYVLEYCI